MKADIRPPAVAGLFYPAEAAELKRNVAMLLSKAAEPPKGRTPKALIVPHAGYIYSGPTAAMGYAWLRPMADQIRRVVLLGPCHRVPVDGLALPAANRFRTPLGEIEIDRELARKTLELPQVVENDSVHAFEHSLEVQLPFLQESLKDFKLLPFAVGDATPEEVGEVIELCLGGKETLVLISSDLSHYLPYEACRRVDQGTAEAIVSLDLPIGHRQACGATPVNGVLDVARRHHWRAELLDLRNSGDTAGDKDRVVGYGAFAFFEGGRS
ncbi:MAG TPA: AmmeMemoRadiSam system protein B [Bdellovibrionota bacterium]|nr:AmmeMemoRadiSam system protein B [Bdellovibrionota bacterium]